MTRPASALGIVVLAVLVACAPDGRDGEGREDDDDTRILVLAASSLTDVFATIEDEFETAEPMIDVEVSYGASSALRVQIEEGAPGDVVAVANQELMDDLDAEGLVTTPAVFATNSVVLAVPTDNPGGVMSIDDFARSDLLLGVCAPQVPCGVYANRVLAESGVDPSIDTEEPDVRSLVTKLVAGELDAGLVYSTDVLSDPEELTSIPLPDGVDVRADVPIAVLADSEAPDAARRFVDFVLSEDGRTILADAGFGLL